MTCPRITRAITSSRLSAPLKHTLRVLTDHINSWKDPTTGQADHTRPATLEVYEAVATLAADTGYSKPTVMVHLLKLRGFTPVPDEPKDRWPQDEQRAVLELIAKSRQHTAARYRLNLERLEALQRSKNLTAEPAEALTSDEPQRSKNLTAEVRAAVKFSGSSGKVSLPEFPKDLPQTKKNFLAHARETRNGTDPPVYTPTPDRLDLPNDFLARCRTTVRELDVDKERVAFLGYCRRHDIYNHSWLGAFWDWLLKAQARYERGEPTASYPRRQTTATTPTTTATRQSCSWAGCEAPPCPHGQACANHACCRACAAEQAADAAIADALAAEEESLAPIDPVTIGVAAAPDALAAAVAVAVEVSVDHDAMPDIDTLDDRQDHDPEGEAPVSEATRAPLVAMGALLRDVLGGPSRPPSVQPLRPLGSGPPRWAPALTWLREQWAEEDQPTYRALIAARRAREAAQPAATGDPP